MLLPCYHDSSKLPINTGFRWVIFKKIIFTISSYVLTKDIFDVLLIQQS